MKKVLLITDVIFWERIAGNRTRIYSLIKFLAANVQLTVVCTGPAPADIEITLARDFNADFFVLEKKKYLSSNGYGRRLKAFLKDKHFDTVIIEYIHSSYFLNFLPEDVQVILDAHDIISERTEEFRKFNHSGDGYELSKETEAEIFSVYDYVMVLCQPDYDKVNAMAGPAKALLCPHTVEPCMHPLREDVKSIVFIASAYLPNKDAISWFIADCWPQISAKYNVQLSVYGTVAGGIDTSEAQQIYSKGVVADLNEIYAAADIVINPVRFGAGLKIKNLEALGYGVPLVTTSHGARGMESGINKAFLVADDAGAFIESVGSLINSLQLRTKLSRTAYKFVSDNYTAEKYFRPLIDVIQ